MKKLVADQTYTGKISNNLEETLDMKVINDVFDANQMFLLPSDSNHGYPVSEAYDKYIGIKKTGLKTFEDTKALELDGVKPKTLSLVLNVDNSITEVRHKRNQTKSWFQARNHLKILYKKGNNASGNFSHCFRIETT